VPGPGPLAAGPWSARLVSRTRSTRPARLVRAWCAPGGPCLHVHANRPGARPGAAVRAPGAPTWWPSWPTRPPTRPPTRRRGARPADPPPRPGVEKIGPGASCAGLCPISHARFHVKQFWPPP
jgi:hypothetical protein